ncbi:hypothetical protein [Burkholderia stagnalis]|uniref:hypothetical protein n=1 Tax=Burkholderia stagnalis TaxID=1503054 RepID=UPI0012D854A3|nr:hypothetical protein [Burkholderia stagnalis]
MRIVPPFQCARLPSARHARRRRKGSSVPVLGDPDMRVDARAARYDRRIPTLPELAMHACCSRQTAAAALRTPASRTGAGATISTVCAAVAARMPGIAAWRRFTQLLASIPDSNDDFGLV